MISFNQIPASFCPETMTVYVNDVPVEQNSVVDVCGWCSTNDLLETQLMLAGYKVGHGYCLNCNRYIKYKWQVAVADLNTIL